METIKNLYYEAYRKYYFNFLAENEFEKVYFMGMADGYAKLFQKETDELGEYRDKAKTDARRDFEFYRK